MPILPLDREERILVVVPHPDDETLGAGGLIAMAREQDIPVRVVFLTNGDGSRAMRLVTGNAYQAMAQIRQHEAVVALEQLGMAHTDIIFLGYPDGGTHAMWKEPSRLYRSPYTKANHSPYANSWTPEAPYRGWQVIEDIEQILRDFQPTLAVTSHPRDTHSDHRAAYAYLSAAVARLRSQQKYFSRANKIRCAAFLIHYGRWPEPRGYRPEETIIPPPSLANTDHWMTLPLEEKARQAKADALQCYRSQLASTPRFLRSFLRRNELFYCPPIGNFEDQYN